MESRSHRRSIILILGVCLALGWLRAPAAIQLGDWDFVPGLRFWGFDLEADYLGFKPLAPLETRLITAVGWGYETYGYYRLADEELYIPPAEDTLATFSKNNLDIVLGIKQGILYYDTMEKNLLEFYTYCRWFNDINYTDDIPGSLIIASGLPDRQTNWQLSVVTGLFLDLLGLDPQEETPRGARVDLSLEMAPQHFFNQTADFYRADLDLRGYLTFLRLGSGGSSNFHAYLADRVALDYLWGDYIPINARQSISNRKILPRHAMGNRLRGIAKGRFDGYIKTVNNFDLRLVFPEIDLAYIPNFRPGMVLYFDTGISSGLDYSFDTADELLYTTGAGVFINILGFDIIFYGTYFINESRLSTTFDFALHF